MVSGRTLVRRGRRKRAPRYPEVCGLCAVPGPGPLLVKVRIHLRQARERLAARAPRKGCRARQTDTGRRRYCFGYS